MNIENDNDRKKRIRRDLNKEAQKKHRRNLTEDQSKEIKSINTSQRKEARVNHKEASIVGDGSVRQIVNDRATTFYTDPRDVHLFKFYFILLYTAHTLHI